MGFELFLQGDPKQTDRLPTRADIERVFEGLIRGDEPELGRLEVGPTATDSCGIYYEAGDGPQADLMVERPVEGLWLWDRLFRLLDGYDLFLFWPDDDPKAVVARPGVPLPTDLGMATFLVADAVELREAIGPSAPAAPRSPTASTPPPAGPPNGATEPSEPGDPSLVERLRRAVRGSRPVGDFYARAKQVRRVPPPELAVVGAALTRGGPFGARIVRQLREADHVWRLVEEDGDYELRISTTDALAIRDVPRDGPRHETGWIALTTLDGRAIDLNIVVDRSGIASLLGRTRDGRPWPDRWGPDPHSLASILEAAPWLNGPTPEDLQLSRTAAAAAIGAWLGVPDAIGSLVGRLRAEPPLPEHDIAYHERREQFPFPSSYRALLLETANGFAVGSVVVLAAADVFRLDMPGPARLVISPPWETVEGAFTLAPTGEVVRVDAEAETSDGVVVAADLRAWVAAQLAG